jgi:hypothetical protein
MFEQRSHDFGVVATGAQVSYRFKMTNIYQQDVHISNVRTTCGCTAAQPSKNLLASLDTAFIEVTMDTRKFKHRKDSNLIVTFDAPLATEVYIPITAYIRTDVVLEPGSASFGAVDQGAGAERKLSVAYAGRGDWTIREVKSLSEHVEARAVERSRDRDGGFVNYDLFVTLKPTHPGGDLRTQVTLVTDDQNNPNVPVLVEAKIEADITVIPAVISLGLLRPGEPRTVPVIVKGKKPFEIEKIECDTDKAVFKVRLPDRSSSQMVHQFPLTVTPPDQTGTFTETFTLTIVGRPTPVTFKAHGQVVAPSAPTDSTAVERSLREPSR